MNKLIFVLALCAALPAAANEYDQMCAARGELAEQVMRARQLGMSLSRLLEISKSDDPVVQRDFRSMALLAYEHPRYSSERVQRQATEEFRDEATLVCLRAGQRRAKPTKAML